MILLLQQSVQGYVVRSRKGGPAGLSGQAKEVCSSDDVNMWYFSLEM